MPIRTTTQAPATIEANRLILGLFEGEPGPPGWLGEGPAADLIGRLLAAKDLPTSVGDATPILGLSGIAAEGLMVVGLGPRSKFGAGPAFSAGVAASRKLSGRSRSSVAIAWPAVVDGDAEAIASALVEGLIVGTRGPGLRKSEPNRHPFGDLIVAGALEPEALARAVRRGEVVGSAVNLARDLVNTPPAEKPPTRLAGRAVEVGVEAGFRVEVWDAARIEAERLGGLAGVAAGSEQPPALVRLEYRGAGDSGPVTALVGKGVTFDSGGLSLKTSSSMEDMKSDMTGAAVVLATFQAVARLGLAVNLDGYLAITENMTGGRALKLGDVLTIRNGKTVEVLNTDAEGRLILADALSLAAESKPARIIDLATLTGACMAALGTRIAGLFSTDDALADALLAAGRRTGERAWRLPLDDDFLDALKSDVADLKNVGGKWGGAITAAKFLQQFVGETPWAHLDIAGPSWADSDSSTRDSGGTGCFVRTLVGLLEVSAPKS